MKYWDESLKEEMLLTKLELFSLVALNGILSNPDWSPQPQDSTANCAVGYAKMLIEELEKTDET